MQNTNDHLGALNDRIKTLKAIRRIVEKDPSQENLGRIIKNLEQIANDNHLIAEDLTYLVQEGYLDPKDANLPKYLAIGDNLGFGLQILSMADNSWGSNLYNFISTCRTAETIYHYYRYAGVDWAQLPSGNYVFDFSNVG